MKGKEKAVSAAKAPRKVPPKVTLIEGTTFKELSQKIDRKPKDILEKLEAKGLSPSLGDPVDESLVQVISREMETPLEYIPLEKGMRLEAESQKDNLAVRPPVVTIMGHVDHGKTTLLDAIRSSHLVEKESGGITQHIGAYRVRFNNRLITFIDTPGHEAFTRLRARGAQVTDIVILVVAADEGVMPQTKEAISHAKAAGVPIIIAINKTDKPEANPERVKQQLSKEGLLVEQWGGEVISVDVSAKEKKNIHELLEMILLLADVIEIKANPKVKAQGVVLEARLDSKKGAVATVIIQQGTLTQGDAFISGTTQGKVRALFDENGAGLKTAGPSMPVEILGFAEVPQAGDLFQVVPDQGKAKLIVEQRLSRMTKEPAASAAHLTLDDLFKKIEEGEVKELPLIIKADVQGSVEVLLDLLPSLGTSRVKIKIIHSGTGGVTDSDILLATASNAIIVAYNVKPGPKIMEFANKENIEVRVYKIIYQLIEDIKKAIAGMLEPVVKEISLGRAEIRRIFKIPKVGVIAGCLVVEGRIPRNAEIKVIRNKEVIHQGRISSLKRLKENVTEVKKDFECGIGLEKFKDILEGDIIEAFSKEKVMME
jgi:translation initiation factor IF-2